MGKMIPQKASGFLSNSNNFVLRKAVSKFNRFLQVFVVGDMVLVVFDFVVLGVFVVCFVLNVVLGPGPVFLPY